MTGNNPKLGLVNVDVHTKFGQILSSHSQDIEQKRIVHGKTERQNDGITELPKDRVNLAKRGYNDGQQSQARPCLC